MCLKYKLNAYDLLLPRLSQYLLLKRLESYSAITMFFLNNQCRNFRSEVVMSVCAWKFLDINSCFPDVIHHVYLFCGNSFNEELWVLKHPDEIFSKACHRTGPLREKHISACEASVKWQTCRNWQRGQRSQEVLSTYVHQCTPILSSVQQFAVKSSYVQYYPPMCSSTV